MTEKTIERLLNEGCEIEIDTEALTDDCDFDCDFVITYHNIFVGSNISTYDDVKTLMNEIDAKGY